MSGAGAFDIVDGKYINGSADISDVAVNVTENKAVAFDVNTPYIKDTKNGIHRTVPIPESIYPAIADYIKGTLHG